MRPNLPRTGVDARELARVLARQQAQTGALLPPIDDTPTPSRAPTRGVAEVATAPLARAPSAAPAPEPAVPAALRAVGLPAAQAPRAPRGMELARAPRALSAMEALDAARAAERATVPGAGLAPPHLSGVSPGGGARGPAAPGAPRLATPRTNTSPFSTARPRVEVPRIEVGAPSAPLAARAQSLPRATPSSAPASAPREPLVETVVPGGEAHRAPRGMSLPPAPRGLSAEEALAAARANEWGAPPEAEQVWDQPLAPVSSALVSGVQAALATSLPDVPARVAAVAVVEPRVHLALWKAHRARLAGQGDLRGALAAAAIIQNMVTRPQHLLFAVVHATPPGTERYFLAIDVDLRVPIAVLPEPERWGVRF